jgi:toxin ParE1/3/4
MKYLLIVRPGAEQQATEAFHWYQEKLTGLGEDFLICLDACITSIIANPNLYQKKYLDIRMGIIEKFPYGIYYIIDDDTIVVLAILHFSRNPEIPEKL